MTATGAKPFLISLAVACTIMGILIATGMNGPQYAIPVHDFRNQSHPDNQTIRLEGTIQDIQTTSNAQEINLCSEKVCIRARIPLQITTDFHVTDDVILTGNWHDNTLWVTKVLKRCHPNNPSPSP